LSITIIRGTQMDKMMIKSCALLLVPLLFFGCFAGCIDTQEKNTLKILHAGSLSVPFAMLEKRFEERYPWVDVQREAYGSAAAIRQVTELGKTADLIASADYTLIDQMMIEGETKWAESNVLFAKNAIVLAYTDSSRGADGITADNWYDVFRGDDVRYGFSNGNLDPCGYRSVMMIQLAESAYGDDAIFDDLVERFCGIYAQVQEDGGVVVNIPSDIAPTGNLMIRPKEVDLVSGLQSGDIDYAIEYRSVAIQHGFNYVELPDAINLGSVDFRDDYAKVSVQQYCDMPGFGELIGAKPIFYGITVTLDAPERDLALKFIELLTGEEGQAIFEESGQPPIVPAVCTGKPLK